MKRPTWICLSGSGTSAGRFAVSPTTLDFGNVVVGSTKSLTETLSATGSSVTVSSATVSSGLVFHFTIAAGQSAPFTLTFIPQASGTASATASLASNASNSPAVESLTGSGTATLQHNVGLSWSPSTSTVAGYNYTAAANRADSTRKSIQCSMRALTIRTALCRLDKPPFT